MKRIITLAAFALLTFPAFADEGMWMLPLLQEMNSKAMSRLGCHLGADDIYSINHSSLKDAIVHFGGGCTGEIISDEGLLSTNHHCGYSHIQALSTPEHNYLEDGYWAGSREEELPVPGLTVTFLERMEDVSAAFFGLDPDAAKEKIAQLCKEREGEFPGCTLEVLPFYNDNAYYLIVSKVYPDVRFVGAPPVTLGKFGGNTDNWMWPRHTCDFSMFRVYAGADNEPAEYSPSNRPYHPRRSLKISLKGVQDGDLAMVMGYPGRTQRYLSAAQLEDMLAVQDVRIAARTVRQDVMWEAQMADPVVNLQYASKFAGSSNGWKKWIGMKESFARLGIIEREKAKEADFENWVAARPKRVQAYGGALEQIDSAVALCSEPKKAFTLLSETLWKVELVEFARTMTKAASASRKDSLNAASIIENAKKEVIGKFKDYSPSLDRKEMSALLEFYCENVREEDAVKFGGAPLTRLDADSLVAEIFDGSRFTSVEGLSEVTTAEDIIKDPAARFASAVVKSYNSLLKASRTGSDAISEGSRKYAAGLLEWKKGEPSYPDANSTMRLTYGNVKSYSPKDGVIYKHYTTLDGVMEKEDPDNYEFRVPSALKAIYEKKDYGRYADSAGQLPTCFLTTCDITGGNSGSPVLDADGNLIGLAFDGNWEAMSGDVMFEPNLQRCICVDIRYVLLALDKMGGAGWLLKEMKFEK